VGPGAQGWAGSGGALAAALLHHAPCTQARRHLHPLLVVSTQPSPDPPIQAIPETGASVNVPAEEQRILRGAWAKLLIRQQTARHLGGLVSCSHVGRKT
jgi:hypothetical protein